MCAGEVSGSMRQTIIEQDLEEIYGRNIPWQELEGKTVLITGAYGMLASYVVYMLLYLNIYKEIHVTIIAVVRSREKFQDRFGSVTRYPFLKVVESDLADELDIDMDTDFFSLAKRIRVYVRLFRTHYPIG